MGEQGYCSKDNWATGDNDWIVATGERGRDVFLELLAFPSIDRPGTATGIPPSRKRKIAG